LSAFFRPGMHYRAPGPFDVATLLVCAQLADLLLPFVVDDNLHPGRPTREVAAATSDLIDLLLRTVGPPLLLLLVAAVVLFGSAGELLLGLVGVATGVLITVLTVGTGGILAYLALVLFLRIAVSVLHVVLAFPLRLVTTFVVLAGLLWLVAQ
jgi:hypothetical protein